jgi:hypothetical protein
VTVSSLAAGGSGLRWLRCGLVARLLSVQALVPKHEGLSLRPFARSSVRQLPRDIILQAAILTLPVGRLLLRLQGDGSLAIGDLWTRFVWCREGLGGRLVDEALLLAREAACTRFSCRLALGDMGFQAALYARGFAGREADGGGLILELAVEPS